MEIIDTRDGSHTLSAPFLGEHYHSLHGAFTESHHIYIDNGIASLNIDNGISVFEMGFGTGLNAFLSLQYARAHSCPIEYVAVDTFPISLDIAKQLNYGSLIAKDPNSFESLHTGPWNKAKKIDYYFMLEKIEARIECIDIKREFDIVFFDAFGPNYQPEVWSLTILKKMFAILRFGGVFVTYCAKGQFKRDLVHAGFMVESLSGPPGKREMVRAIKL